jgi:hypothetical protein
VRILRNLRLKAEKGVKAAQATLAPSLKMCRSLGSNDNPMTQSVSIAVCSRDVLQKDRKNLVIGSREKWLLEPVEYKQYIPLDVLWP